ncbi:tRNA pseudouridine(38-40) synthase TruA [Paenibacillus sp. PsM32]|uniref:tRNA pseudouridine(38-40) synthase TruA n=1 Tax=Paenibacillus sp. PsM32 TaxID=3030536 RepID=UPI00263AECAF|nr:tRNA pseudouridine(38-40) synthase TruA [Paenibacillus sp. PsM32]MDN4620719.1 tRNA pseudouridine(38-40) synthase TruA [Paenibacillus sp. PsM32]
MRNLCMTVNYDGTRYNGFQTQPDGNTIQDHLEKAIASIIGEKPKIHGSGRTDAGVHAIGQVFHFLTESTVPAERWPLALNGRLPKDIIVTNAREVHLDFHSRRSAKRKTYRYTINANQYPDVFLRHMQLHHPGKLNIGAMREALSYFIGTYDFTTFASKHSEKQSHIRTIYEARLEVDYSMTRPDTRDQGILHFYITGSGFLQHMVRIIIGTLVQVGEGKHEPDAIPRMIAAEDRSMAGPTAVSKALTMWGVHYEEFNT